MIHASCGVFYEIFQAEFRDYLLCLKQQLWRNVAASFDDLPWRVFDSNIKRDNFVMGREERICDPSVRSRVTPVIDHGSSQGDLERTNDSGFDSSLLMSSLNVLQSYPKFK